MADRLFKLTAVVETVICAKDHSEALKIAIEDHCAIIRTDLQVSDVNEIPMAVIEICHRSEISDNWGKCHPWNRDGGTGPNTCYQLLRHGNRNNGN